MGTFFITLDADAVYATDAPLLEILVDGVVVSSLSVTAGFGTSSYSIDFAGNYPGTLSFRFNDGSSETGRSIQINSVAVNKTNVAISQSTLTQGTSSDANITSLQNIFDETELTLSDLGVVTVQGTNASEVLNGTANNDVMDGGSLNDNIRGYDGDDKIYAGNGADVVSGGNGNDLILGGLGNDLLKGEAGNDTIYGGDGHDIIRGGDGDDIIHGNAGRDNVRGDLGNDIIFGGTGNDVLRGEAGNDVIFGGVGLDLLDGGDGDDLLSGGDDNDTLRGGIGADTLFGDAGHDRLFGDDGDDTLNGGAGNDLIDGGNGNDLIDGGTGNDIIKAGAGNDTIEGGDGHDLIYAEDGDDVVNGGAGRDKIEGGAGNDILRGGDDNDTILGGEGVDYVYGDAGNDRVRGGDGDDFVYGGDGNDQVFGDAGNDQVWGGAGNDLVNGNEGDDILYGEAGFDKMFGHEGNDTIYGGDDNDRIYGNEGSDIINGDDGDDVLYASSEQEIVTYTQTIAEVAASILAQNTGVFYNADTNSFYRFVAGSFNYNTANNAANNATLVGLTGVNGHLATITSAAETAFVTTITGTNYAWVNGSDAAAEGTWVYTSGAEAGTTFWTGGAVVNGQYANFYNGVPLASSGTYDYSLFLGSNYSGQIYAYTQTYNSNYLIEWDAGDLSLLATTYDEFKVMDQGESNIINGGAGADTIYGSAGNDILNGGEGNDAIYSGTAATVQSTIDDILAANSGVVYNEATNSFYKYVTVSLSHTLAEAAANAATLNGLDGVTGHLAKLSNAAEQSFVGSIVNGGTWAWVNGSDTASEGNFVYDDGTAFSTSLNWNGGSVASTNQDVRDNVIIWDGGGDTLYAWADTSNANGYVIEWDVGSLVSSIGTNTLNGGNGADDLYGGAGRDIFVFDNTNDVDDVFNFNRDVDAIDINAVISYNSATDVLSNFVQFTEVGGNTLIAVDSDGLVGGANFTTIASLDGVTGLDINALLAAGNLIVE